MGTAGCIGDGRFGDFLEDELCGEVSF